MAVKISELKVNGEVIEYATFGEGEKTFVIIPGLSIKSVIESAQLVENAYSDFNADYTSYLFDRRKNVREGYSIYDMADDIALSLEKLGIENACVFGTSQGGMIAQQLAIKYPRLVGKLVLASTAARPNEKAKAVINNWISLAEKGEVKALCEDFVEKLYTEDFAKQYSEGIVAYNSACSKEELERFIILARACDIDFYKGLEKIKCPVLVIGAENDAVFGKDTSLELAEKLDSECFIYPAPYSHAVYDEAPDYKKRLLEFYSK